VAPTKAESEPVPAFEIYGTEQLHKPSGLRQPLLYNAKPTEINTKARRHSISGVLGPKPPARATRRHSLAGPGDNKENADDNVVDRALLRARETRMLRQSRRYSLPMPAKQAELAKNGARKTAFLCICVCVCVLFFVLCTHAKSLTMHSL
jgi:hypothetical protein